MNKTQNTFRHEMMNGNQISCITAPNLQFGPMQITRLTLIIDNSTHYFPLPFTYQPDPIITAIEPAESFLSGGRLLLITGHHLSSPQSIRLMLYQEHKHLPINGTSCVSKNDSLIACLTPAIPRSLVVSSLQSQAQSFQSNHNQYHYYNSYGPSANGQINTSTNSSTAELAAADLLTSQGGGFKLRMYLMMDDVKSVRNLEDYYHHLPHFLTYFEDPKLHRLSGGLVEYSPELMIEGENLQMSQLDQDILITIGTRASCQIKSIDSQRLVCEPPAKIEAQYDLESGRLLERANLPIVGLVGSHLSFALGHMQYTSQQYLPATTNQQQQQRAAELQVSRLPTDNLQAGAAAVSSNDSMPATTSIVLLLSAVSFVVSLLAALVFALHRSRQSKKERQYKRIQLQMGSLDINGQPIILGSNPSNPNNNAPFGGGLFAAQGATLMVSSAHQANGGAMCPALQHTLLTNNNSNQRQQQQHYYVQQPTTGAQSPSLASSFFERARQMRLRALDYITGQRSSGLAASSTSTSSSLVFANGATSSPTCGKNSSAGLMVVNKGSSLLYYGNNPNNNGTSSSLFSGPLAGDLIQQQQQQHNLVLSKLTPNGKIVSANTQTTLQRRLMLNQGANNNTVTSLLRSANSREPNYVAATSASNATLNFASNPMVHSYAALTSSTSPLVSYSSNYNNNINLAEHNVQPDPNTFDNDNGNSHKHVTSATNGRQGKDCGVAANSPASSSYSSTRSSSNPSSGSSSQQCSPGSSTRTPISSRQAQNQQTSSAVNHQENDRPNRTTLNSWMQNAPSTVVPYSVIEACNLTLEGINAIKHYV